MNRENEKVTLEGLKNYLEEHRQKILIDNPDIISDKLNNISYKKADMEEVIYGDYTLTFFKMLSELTSADATYKEFKDSLVGVGLIQSDDDFYLNHNNIMKLMDNYNKNLAHSLPRSASERYGDVYTEIIAPIGRLYNKFKGFMAIFHVMANGRNPVEYFIHDVVDELIYCLESDDSDNIQEHFHQYSGRINEMIYCSKVMKMPLGIYQCELPLLIGKYKSLIKLLESSLGTKEETDHIKHTIMKRLNKVCDTIDEQSRKGQFIFRMTPKMIEKENKEIVERISNLELAQELQNQ